MTTYSAEFEEHIRDLLSNLYDYLKLVNNPVAQRLVPQPGGSERMHAIRRLVLAAIEQLRSETSANPASRQNRLYHILLLRYVEEQNTGEVVTQLALSERQYYREHQRAIQTISRIIWDEYFAAAGSADGATLSLADELNYLNVEGGRHAFVPAEEIRSAIEAARVIAESRGIVIRPHETREPIRLNVSQPVFRQLVIYLLNALIGAAAAESAIEIELGTLDDEPAVHFGAMELPAGARDLCLRLAADETARALLESLNAGLTGCDRPARITLAFRGAIQRILIVDDNPDTVSLFQRYLANLPYQLLSAQNEGEAMRIARGTPLLCIILDVMLPGKDGWQILQSCKNHPDTAETPILICSVLEMEELALSLGADGYLKKPPTRDALLATLRQWAG